MATPSPELLAISRRWCKTVIEHGKHPIRNFMSESDALRFLGTAHGENWSGQDVRDGVDEFFRQHPDVVHYEELFAEAFEEGDVGWALFIHRLTFAGKVDAPVEHRDTFVFKLEHGSWKIIHRHGSVPTANEVAMGIEQTGIAQLVESARESTSLNQTEGLASVMFTDVVQSSVLANALGDRAWSAKINAHFSSMRSIVEDHGGQFVKSLGDGTMSSFASARSAMSAAQDIQNSLAKQTLEPRLAVRVGIHTGDVVQTREDFFGSVVNIAARIADIAGSGEIIVSDVTRALVGGDPKLEFEPRGQHDLPGQSVPTTLHALTWRR